jgi:sigma-E factor negative regulatory protein RseA
MRESDESRAGPGAAVAAGRRHEMLSALMDGEASEHELRQLLRASEEDPALAASWRRWHLAQSALRGQAFNSADLRSRVAARLDAPVAAAAGVAAAPARSVPAWLKPLASAAVAASVTLFTVFAWQAFQPAAVAPLTGDVVAANTLPVGPRVALGPMVMVREDGEELVMPVAAAATDGAAVAGESPTAAQDRINAYLARHAQAAGAANASGLSPYARVVSLEGEQAP